MSAQPEDKRAAAALAVSISGFVMTAALGIIAAQAAIVTFTIDKKDHLAGFFGAALPAFALLVTSIVCGGKGMAYITGRGHEGDWQIKTPKGLFNWQATLTLAALPLTILSLFLGRAKAERTPPPAGAPPAPMAGPGSRLRVEPLPLDAVFVTGEPCRAESGPLEDAVARAADSLRTLASSAPIAYVLVVGSADTQELRPRARTRLGSNLALAQLRGECVAEALRRQLASPPALPLPAIIPLVRGPRHPGREQWPHDRAVQVWAVALQSTGPHSPGAN